MSAPQHRSWGCNAQRRVSRVACCVWQTRRSWLLGRGPEKVGRQLVSLGDMAHSMRVRRPGKVQGREAKDRRRGASKLVDAPVEYKFSGPAPRPSTYLTAHPSPGFPPLQLSPPTSNYLSPPSIINPSFPQCALLIFHPTHTSGEGIFGPFLGESCFMDL